MPTHLGVLFVAALVALFVVPIAASSAATYASDPCEFVQSVAANTTEIARTQSGANRDRAMRGVLHDDFDVPYMARTALGPHWSAASDQQRTRILAAVESSEAHALGERLGGLPGTTLKIGTATPTGPGVWLVDSRLQLPGGPSIKVEWEVRDASSGLRVSDIRVEGVSQFRARRADYQSYIRSHGGAVEPLVEVLEARATR
jgi:phospholipid transport system substrate-binding protein